MLFCLALKVPQSVLDSTPVTEAVDVAREYVQVAEEQVITSAGPEEAKVNALPVAVVPPVIIVVVT
jgi:hypothetical protein